eukprot:728046_1
MATLSYCTLLLLIERLIGLLLQCTIPDFTSLIVRHKLKPNLCTCSTDDYGEFIDVDQILSDRTVWFHVHNGMEYPKMKYMHMFGRASRAFISVFSNIFLALQSRAAVIDCMCIY